MAALRPSSASITFFANSGDAEGGVGRRAGSAPQPEAAVVQRGQLVVRARQGGGGHGVGVGDGQGIGGGVNAGVQRHLRRGGEVPVHMTAVEVDDGHHLGRDRTQVGPGGSDGDQVPLAGGDVAGRADDEALLGQVAARTRHGFSCLAKSRSLIPGSSPQLSRLLLRLRQHRSGMGGTTGSGARLRLFPRSGNGSSIHEQQPQEADTLLTTGLRVSVRRIGRRCPTASKGLRCRSVPASSS